MALAGPLSVWRDPRGAACATARFHQASWRCCGGNVEALRAAARDRGVEIVGRELHGANDLPPTFDDVKSAGAQAAIFIDGQCDVRTAEEGCRSRACSQASVDPFA